MNIILDQARLLLEQGRLKDAETRIRQFLQQEPGSHYALSLLARCMYEGRQFNEGIALMQKAVSLEPQESFYFYLLAFGYYQQDRLTEAFSNLGLAIQLNPYHAEYYGLLAFVLLAEKSFSEALQKADEGLAIEADNISCLNARAMALNKMRKTEAAMATMQDALALDPDSEFTHNTIGWSLLERGRHKEATTHFRESLRINPMQQNARLGLKEALKSRVLPYKWLLQYGFWLNNRGRRLKGAMPVIIYLVFRLLIIIFSRHRGMEALAVAAGALYILFVIGSWTMNAIACFFLLFYRDGKYALIHSEKWSSILVVSAMISGCVVLLLALVTPLAMGSTYEDTWFGGGLVLLSLALPLGEIDYPLRFKIANNRNRLSILLMALGLLSILGALFFPAQALLIMAVYGIAFLLYNWSGALGYK